LLILLFDPRREHSSAPMHHLLLAGLPVHSALAP
jgi:hypothetical protein